MLAVVPCCFNLSMFSLSREIVSKKYGLPGLVDKPRLGVLRFDGSDQVLKCKMERNVAGQLLIEVCAPLKVVNVLVSRLSFHVRKSNQSASDATLEENTLDPGAASPIYSLACVSNQASRSDKQLFQIKFRIEDVGQSNWLPLNNLKKKISFAVRDKRGRLHLFHLMQSRHLTLTNALIVYSKFVLVNRTGLPISYARRKLLVDRQGKLTEGDISDNEVIHQEILQNSKYNPENTSFPPGFQLTPRDADEKRLFMHSTSTVYVGVHGVTKYSKQLDLTLVNTSQDFRFYNHQPLAMETRQITRTSDVSGTPFRNFVAHIENSIEKVHGFIANINYVHIVPQLLLLNCTQQTFKKQAKIYVAQNKLTDFAIALGRRSAQEDNLVEGVEMVWLKDTTSLLIQVRTDDSGWSPLFSPFHIQVDYESQFI